MNGFSNREKTTPADNPVIVPTYFFLGWLAITAQTVVLREFLVVSLGNEIVFGLFLSCWLMGVFGGALVGGRQADRTGVPLRRFITAAVLFWVLSLAAPFLTRASFHLSGTPAGAYITFESLSLLAAVLIVPLGALIGYSFPMAARIAKDSKSTESRPVHAVSTIYIFEALGALGGGTVTSFILLSRVNPFTILALSALPLLAMLSLAGRRGRRPVLASLMLACIVIDLCIFIPFAGPALERLSTAVRWRGFSANRLIDSRDSRYQNLALGKGMEQFTLYTSGQFASVFPEEIDNRVLAAHLVAQHEDPKRVLVIGQAVDGLVQEMLRYDLTELTNIELDPEAVRMIREFLPAGHRKIFSDPRFSLRFGDGRRLITVDSRIGATGHWDIIFLNLPEPSTLLLNRFYTREFFHDAAAVLAADGVLSLGITSSENYAAGIITRYTATVYHALSASFPHVVVAPGHRNLFFASRSPSAVSADPAILQERYSRSGVEPRSLGLVFHSLYPREKTEFIEKALRSGMEEIANSDARPIAIHHFGRILGWASGSGGGVFEAVDRLQPAVLPPAVALVLGFLLAAVFLPRLRGAALRSADDPGGFMTRLRRRGATSAIPVYTTVVYGGLAGISMELLIIYAFQLTHGYIYQLVGFIISLFMCGLPGGAAWARSRIRNAAKDGRRNRLFLMGILAATTVLAAVFPRLISLLAAAGDAGAPLFYFLTVVVGFLTGAIFPFSLDLQMKKSGRVGREAGGIDAADHLGAALGAFFCGALLLPVLGIAGVSFLVTGLTASAAILLGLTMPPRPH